MARCNRENPNSRNFGLQSRDMAKAGHNALREELKSFSSIQTMSERFSQFASYAKNELNIRDMRKLTRENIQQYASSLLNRCEKGEVKPATAQNYLSAVNRTLEIARGDRALYVAPVRDANLPHRSGIATENRANQVVLTEQLQKNLPERLLAQIELQRNLGLRFEESCKINAITALSQAEKQEKVIIKEGTKGGRSREIPITRQEQITALRAAAAIQGRDRSMIPRDQTYREYKAHCYQISRENGLKGFHQNRHEYAQSRYEAITGVSSPICSGVPHGKGHHLYVASAANMSLSEATRLDAAARAVISAELGHGRIEISNSYLG